MANRILQVVVGTESQSEIDEIEKKIKKALEESGETETIVIATKNNVEIREFFQGDEEEKAQNFIFNLLHGKIITQAEARDLFGIDKK